MGEELVTELVTVPVRGPRFLFPFGPVSFDVAGLIRRVYNWVYNKNLR